MIPRRHARIDCPTSLLSTNSSPSSLISFPHRTHTQWSSARSSLLGKHHVPRHHNGRLTIQSGTGYIGSFTALALLEADYKVVIVDNLYNSSEEVINRIELISGKRPEFYNVDICDEAALDKVFSEHPDIDNVIHFAALKVHRLSLMATNRQTESS